MVTLTKSEAEGILSLLTAYANSGVSDSVSLECARVCRVLRDGLSLDDIGRDLAALTEEQRQENVRLTVEAEQEKATHDQLCDAAVRWLYGAGKCKFVMREPRLGIQEQPDAIGWFGARGTVLIECKANRSDFLADRKKAHRQMPNTGMGSYRYYLCPKDLIAPQEVPEKWGLIYIYPSGQVRRVKRAEVFKREERNTLAEDFLMFAMLRRFAQTGRWHQVEASWAAEVPNEPLSLPAPIHEVRP